MVKSCGQQDFISISFGLFGELRGHLIQIFHSGLNYDPKFIRDLLRKAGETDSALMNVLINGFSFPRRLIKCRSECRSCDNKFGTADITSREGRLKALPWATAYRNPPTTWSPLENQLKHTLGSHSIIILLAGACCDQEGFSYLIEPQKNFMKNIITTGETVGGITK
jgi:hypothetical protein